MSNFIVKKVAVLGAGVMGAQIAAHCINAKVPVVLFDLPAKDGPKNGIVLRAVENLKKLNPAPLGNKDQAGLIEVANYEDHLEFLSIKVQDGPLTSRLQYIKVGDKIVVGRKPTGTLLINYLLQGKHLYLIGTGTGLAPFLSIVRDPETYERFEKVILVHGVRDVAELAYRDYLTSELQDNEFLGEMVSKQLLYYPTVTREAFVNQGRVTTLMESGKIQADLGLPPLDPAYDRVMICGSPGMLRDLKHLLEKRDFIEGNTTKQADFVIERAFAEQ